MPSPFGSFFTSKNSNGLLIVSMAGSSSMPGYPSSGASAQALISGSSPMIAASSSRKNRFIGILLFSCSRTFVHCPGGDGCITSSGSYPHYSGERAARLCKLSTLLCKSCRYIWEKIIRIRQYKSYLPRFRWKSVGEMPTVLRKVRRKEEYELNPLWNAASVSDTPEAISSFAPQMRRNWMYSYTDVFV